MDADAAKPAVRALIVTLPGARGVIQPLLLITAIVVSEDDHSKVRPGTTMPDESRAVATSCTRVPISIS